MMGNTASVHPLEVYTGARGGTAPVPVAKPRPGVKELAIGTSTITTRVTPRSSVSSLTIRERSTVLIGGDVLASTLAALFATLLWGWLTSGSSWSARAHWIAILPAAWMLASLLIGSYVRPQLHRTVRSWGMRAATAGLLFAGYSVVYFLAPRALLPRLVVIAYIGTVAVLVSLWRWLWDWASGHEAMKRTVVIVGAGHQGTAVADILESRPNAGYRVVGFVDDDPAKDGLMVPVGFGRGVPVYGSSASLLDVIAAKDADEVVLAFGGLATPELVQAALSCHEQGVIVTTAADLFEETTGRVATTHIGENWGAVLPLAHPGGRALNLAAKRMIDVIGALVGLSGLLVMLPVLALLIKLDSRGPVMYGQFRSGRGGRRFKIWKLRTMTTDAEANGPVWCAPKDPRMTRVGRWLRRTHVDELPQLWNVLVGDMSLVGPRPERPEIDARLEQVISFYRLRLAVKPGIAGWGAVNGSYVDADEKALERLEYDLYYIKHQSLWLDVQIILSAARRALTIRGR